jgi:phage terminase large subunit-like protein
MTLDPKLLEKMRMAIESYSPAVRRYMLYTPMNDAQEGFHFSNSPERLIIGSNKIGKSKAGCVEVISLATGIRPISISAAKRTICRLYPDGRRGKIQIISINYKQQKASVLDELDITLPKEWLFKHNIQRNVYTIKRFDEKGNWYNEPGVEIHALSIEQGREAIQGGSADAAWVDEEPEEPEFQEVRTMLSTRSGILMATLTPLKTAERGGVSWLSDKYVNPARKGTLDPSKASVFFGKRGDQIHASGRKMTKDEIENWAESMDPWMVSVRVDGGLCAAGTATIFSPLDIANMTPFLTRPILGSLIGKSWQPSKDGDFRLYKKPIKDHNYIIAADVSEGDNGSDFSVAHVIDLDADPDDPCLYQEQVLVFRSRIDPAEYASVLADLGNWYNNALLVPEANPGGGGGVVLHELLMTHQYSNIMPRPTTLGDRSKPQPNGAHKYGWLTTKASRPKLIADLRESIKLQDNKKPKLVIHCDITINEMLIFSRNPKGIIGAPSGKHDDCVISLGIAASVVTLQPPTIRHPTKKPHPQGWSPWNDISARDEAKRQKEAERENRIRKSRNRALVRTE